MNKLYVREQSLIEIFRYFSFLEKEGYEISDITYAGRELPSIVYKNKNTKIRVRVIGSETDYNVVVSRQRFWAFNKRDYVFDVSDYYKYYFCGMIKGKNYTLKSQADFIQQNLMPVIKGEIWVNKLLKSLTKNGNNGFKQK